MKVLIIGNGGREYAIGLALKNDKQVKEIFFAPGNGATTKLGYNIPIKDHENLALFAEQNSIDLSIVGPEAPLVEGIVDIFEKKNLVIFGANKAASRLEGSKVFMKEFLARHNIPTARFLQTSSLEKAKDFIKTLATPVVVKADGLCAGKGVIIAKTHEEALDATKDMLSGTSFGEAGKQVIIEEFLDGYELSVFAVCDGEDFVLLPAAQDHKRLLDGDKGVNTGGMGAYAPTPLANEKIYEELKKSVIKPTLKGMKDEGNPYKGVLFIGLMVVKEKIYVLEYNVRFGDPECEVLMPLIGSSVFDLFYKGATGNIKNLNITFKKEYAVGVVMASENYPFSPSKPSQIIVDKLDESSSHIAYAGVSCEDGLLYADGGRVLVCVGLGKSIDEATKKAYELCGNVHFAGKQFRNDIAYQARS